jgi:hypothetical protein
MTHLVVEQGRMAASITAPVRGGTPAVAASVRTVNPCRSGRRGLDLIGGKRRLWQPTKEQGHTSPLAGARFIYCVPATSSLDVAPG